MGPARRHTLRVSFIVGAPAALAMLEMFHPHPHDVMNIPLDRWMIVHYGQLALFPLAAWSMVLLVEGMSGFVPRLCRTAMFVFGTSYVAFDTAAGIVTGILVRAAQATHSPDAWRGPVLAVWNHPIVGGSIDGAPALAVIGIIAWLIGSLAAAVAARRAGHSWLPTVCLVVSAFGLFVFHTHAWPGGPVTFGALAMAAAVAEWEAEAHRERQLDVI